MSEEIYKAARADRELEEIAKGVFGPRMVKPAGKHARPRRRTSPKEDEAMRRGFMESRAAGPGETTTNPYPVASKQGNAYSRGRLEQGEDTGGAYNWLSQPAKHVRGSTRPIDQSPTMRRYGG